MITQSFPEIKPLIQQSKLIKKEVHQGNPDFFTAKKGKRAIAR